jgi:hypothetical protein
MFIFNFNHKIFKRITPFEDHMIITFSFASLATFVKRKPIIV